MRRHFLAALLAAALLAGTVAPATAAPRPLTLAEAVALGLQSNLQAVLAAGQLAEAQGALRQALARLFPRVEGDLSETRQKLNLAAFGLPAPPGESSIVGPFNVFDARLRASQILFDGTELARAGAARSLLAARRLSLQQARDLVVAAVADLYLEALADRARIEATASQVRTAEAAARLAEDRHDAGLAAGIDTLRAQVTLAEQRERLIDAENDLAKRKLALARAVGLPPGTPLELADAVPYAPLAGRGLLDLETALAGAERSRSDLAAAEAEVAAAELAVRAARRQRFPSLAARGDFGPIGPDVGSAENTFSISAGIAIPLFEGGRIAGEAAVAEGRAQQARARLGDLERQVEVEVRSAFLDVTATARQVEVAGEARRLAEQQLTQAQDRFSAGVAGNLEVVQAQEALATASERQVQSLYRYNRAKVGLALALGVAEQSTIPMLQGERR